MTTVFATIVEDSSALTWQAGSEWFAVATILSALILWRWIKWSETNRALQPATVPQK